MKNMKKIIFPALLLITTFAFVGCTTNSNTANNSTDANIVADNVIKLPDRPAELNGIVRSIEGNEVILANEIREQTLTEEEKAAKQAERKSMTQEERQALRAAEMESVETETVTFTIPVGVPILKGSGAADGTSVNADLAEIKSGSYISVWVNNNETEAVKLKGVN